MARTRFIRLAGVGLLLAAAIQIVFTSGIFVSTAIAINNLRPLQAVVSAALLIGLIALVIAQENDLGRLGYVGFGIALAAVLSTLTGYMVFVAGFRLNGISFILLFISRFMPHDPRHSGVSAETYVIPIGLWLTSLCMCAGLSLFGLASMRARRIPRWGAGALLAIGLLQLPFVLFFMPFATNGFTVFPTSVYSASLQGLRISSLPISLMTALLWGILGIALLRYSLAELHGES